MTMIRALPCLFLLIACASNGVRNAETHYVTEVTSDDANKQFVITVESKSAVKLCLSANAWPNNQGEILDGASFALLVGAKVVTPTNPRGDTCVLGCPPIEISPGQTISGKVNYGNFPVMSSEDLQGSRLLVLSNPHQCSPADYPIRAIEDASPLQREP